MKKVLVLVVLLMTTFAFAAKKQCLTKHPLNDAMINGAILLGSGSPGKELGLTMKDTSQGIFAAMDAIDGRVTTTTGFSLVIYSPYCWVAQNASWKAKKYMPFTTADVTDDMTRGVLRVYANPDRPREVSGEGMWGASGVDHVIVRSTKKKGFEVLQPIAIEEDLTYAQNAFGAEVGFSTAYAVFDLDGVKRISALDKKGEFYVLIIGTSGEEKKFKIKTKHFDRLQ